MGREPRGQGPSGPGSPEVRDQAGSGLDTAAAVLGPGPDPHTSAAVSRLDPWPVGSLAHMVLGPWAPGPYLQGRNMT